MWLSLPPPGGGFIIYKAAHRPWLRRLPIAPEEELEVLDCAYRLNYYYSVSLDCFPLFLHFLISPIKLILWPKCFHRQKAEDTGWGGGKDRKVLLCFTTSGPPSTKPGSRAFSSSGLGLRPPSREPGSLAFSELHVCHDFKINRVASTEDGAGNMESWGWTRHQIWFCEALYVLFCGN